MHDTTIVSARLPKDLAEWVTDEFPHGFKQTFILQCFRSLRYVMTEGEMPPQSDYARLASIEAIKDLAKL